MAITGIQGTNPKIIIIEDSATVNGFSTVNTSWVFGTVRQVYPGCNTYVVGDSVFYDKSQAKRFKYVSINYFAVDEQYIIFTETPAEIIH